MKKTSECVEVKISPVVLAPKNIKLFLLPNVKALTKNRARNAYIFSFEIQEVHMFRHKLIGIPVLPIFV
jgi:hypothetical protein